ncbi:MAG: glycine cleavage system protein T [Rhodospirillaceae bacterium]|nr:glycine cleavage system protein T [Magnetovibrio sp.]MAY67368.1 glycine cleavage system protein T [Rhodospirillaceae bacterium]
MTEQTYVVLEDRGVLALAGDNARTFLQGLISNDINKVTPTQAIHAALLTPQGKYLHDFFIVEGAEGTLLLDGERARLDDLAKRLKLYKLRAKVTIEDQSEQWRVAALPGGAGTGVLGSDAGAAQAKDGGVLFVDPRLTALGARAILPTDGAEATLSGLGLRAGDRASYDVLRLSLGVPDGSRDLIVDKSILLESGFDELNGIDWKKGCYMGQELTARTKYRGLVRKRLLPVEIEGTLPERGTPVTLDGKEVGEVRSTIADGTGGRGLAMIRLEHLDAGGPFEAAGARITPHKPDWAEFQTES